MAKKLEPGEPGYKAPAPEGVPDVAPDIGTKGARSGFGSTIQQNGLLIQAGAHLTIYDLIQFGPGGVIPDVLTQDLNGAWISQGASSGRDIQEYLKEKLTGTGGDTPASFPSKAGSGWKSQPEITANIKGAYRDKKTLGLAILDWAGFVGYRWMMGAKLNTESTGFEIVPGAALETTYWDSLAGAYYDPGGKGFTYGGEYLSNENNYAGTTRLTWDLALNIPLHLDRVRLMWQPVGGIRSEFNFSEYFLTADNVTPHGGDSTSFPTTGIHDLNNPAATVTLDHLPFGGRFFLMTTQEFCQETGIDIRALTTGKFKPVDYNYISGDRKDTLLNETDGGPEVLTQEMVEDAGADWTIIYNRRDARKDLMKKEGAASGNYGSKLTPADILAYNYFYINEDKAQAAFNVPKEIDTLNDILAHPKSTPEDIAAAKKKIKSKLKAAKNRCDPAGDISPYGREGSSTAELAFNEKCVLAANLTWLAYANRMRGFRIKKYKHIELTDGSPPDFINKLYMQEGFMEFAHNSTNLQLSHMLPFYRFYKITYDDGCPDDQVEIVFPQKSDLLSMISSHGRGQVGVKNIEWKYISDNVSTVRNDIEATVTLFFQNFNALTEVHDPGDRQWQYLDLLRRPPKDWEALATEQESFSTRGTPCAGEKPLQTAIGGASSGTIEDKAGGSATGNQNGGYPEWHEIKLVVGWGPPSFIPNDPQQLIKKGVSNSATPLFLTLIDHSFDIRQDGVFELTLTYRARIEGLLSDGRANILATPRSRDIRHSLEKQLEDAKKACDDDTIKSVKGQIKTHNNLQKAWLGDVLLGPLARGTGDFTGRTQIYTAVVSNEDLMLAQFRSKNDATPVTIDNHNCDVIVPRAMNQSLQAIANEQGTAMESARNEIGVIDRDNLGYQLTNESLETGKDGSDPGALVSNVNTDIAVNNSTAAVNAQYENLLDRNLDYRANDAAAALESTLEDYAVDADSTDDGYMRSITDWFHDNVYGGDVPNSVARLTKAGALSETLEDKRDETGKKYKFYPIHFMYAGDLINQAAYHALDYEGNPEIQSKTAFSGCTLQNVKILLGPLQFRDLGGTTRNINIADIPISLRAYGLWFKKHITNPNRSSYSLLTFIRDIIKMSLLDVFTADCFDGAFKQPIVLKTGIMSVPMMEDGTTPIHNRIQSAGIRNYSSPVQHGAPAPIWFPQGTQENIRWTTGLTLAGNRLPLGTLTTQHPLHQINVWDEAVNMIHYVYVYAESAEPSVDLTGDFNDDKTRGIYHLYMGAEKGLVKGIKFSKTDQPYLREQRFQETSLNPLNELAAVYKADVRMVGSTMFYPGQYVFINMMPIGQDMGHPGDDHGLDGHGSYANQLGLGGYHLVTKVTNEITSDNQFETNLQCLWDNSGDGRSRLHRTSLAKVDSCPAEGGNTAPPDPGTSGAGIEEP